MFVEMLTQIEADRLRVYQATRAKSQDNLSNGRDVAM
jgi:hypothetical protein